MDVLLIVVLAFFMAKAIPSKNSIGDCFGYFMASLLLYGIAKAPFILLLGGFTFPVNPDPNLHAISGIIAFILVTGFHVLVYQCRVQKKNVFQLLRRE